MDGRYYRYIRTEIAVVAYRYFGVVLNRQIEIPEKVFPDLRVFSVVESDRPLNKAALSEFSDYFGKKFGAFFRFVFMRAVVIDIEIVRFEFYCFQFRVGGVKQNTRPDFFFLSHFFSSA